ncbi:MAG: amidohydrolase family protein [Anaerolineae bacterium]
MRIDSHQHFWRYNAGEYGWISEEMGALRRDFLPVHLKPLLETAGLEGSVAVQARQSLEETAWLLELADQHPWIQGVVGWVDLRSPEVEAQLERFAAHPKMRGVRHVVQDEPDDRFLLRDDFRRGLRLLSRYGLTYDILIFPRHLTAAIELVQQFPDQPFVLDHIAKPFIKAKVMEPWASQIRHLARYPNVYCKVSGMVTEADWAYWEIDDFRPYLDVVFEAFGAQRIMFGSDWPVCTVAASYCQVADIVHDYTRSLSPDEREAVWGGTAERFYGLGGVD